MFDTRYRFPYPILDEHGDEKTYLQNLLQLVMQFGICAKATITEGITIRRYGAIVAAGAVVTKDVPAYAMVTAIQQK